MRSYLIPANTKKGQLILGMFKPFDLVLFGTGILITFIFLAIMPLESTFVTILVLSPAVVTGFLVFPVPYYHNILNILIELYEFINNNQEYVWKGWCYKNGDKVIKKR